MTNLGLGARGALAVAALGAWGCTGEHAGNPEGDVPAASCTFMPQMTAEIPEARQAQAIGLHGEHVYLRLRGSVVRVPKAGGPLQAVAEMPPVSLAERPLIPEVTDGEY